MSALYILQELSQLDAPVAEMALQHFRSCVRTTLLISHGYECQEKVQIKAAAWTALTLQAWASSRS